MMSHPTFAVAVVLVFACAQQVSAIPITEADFDDPTLIDFNSVGSGILSPSHPNPFAPLGVTFTGFVTSVFGQSPFSGNELRSGFATGLPHIVRADFSVPVNRVGAHAYAGFSATLTVSIYDESNALIESIVSPAPVFTAPQFFGLESAVPIGRVEFIGSLLTTNPGIDNFRFEETTMPPPLLVDVDIKPGSDPNSVNLGSRGLLPVAILTTTNGFDAIDVDVDTILFGDPVLLDAGGIGVSPFLHSLEDVNDDGYIDLSLKFKMDDLIANGALGDMSMEAILTGALLGGRPIEGSDAVRLGPPGDGNEDQVVTAAVPEPSTFVLCLVGLLAYGGRRRRRA